MEGPALPPAYLARMQSLLGAEFPAFLESYSQPAQAGLRINPLKDEPARLLARLPFRLEPLPWCPHGFRLLEAEVQPGKHPYHAAGLYYLQEPSAMAAVEILAPQPGECVLDLAAAPGGKSTHLIARMGDQGLLVANEIHPQRAWDLAENLERWGAARAVITNETPQRLAERLGAAFDRVLLDAPCSGEGMFRKSPASRAEWSPGQVLACARRQADILEQAAALVRPGGWLAYTTCTFAPEEDEALVGRFLERRADFEIAAIPPQAGFTPARPDWLPADPPAGLQSAVRLWPHRAPGEGHFIALLRRRGGEEAPRPRARRPARRAVPAQAARLFEDFRRQALPGAQFAGELALRGSYLYALPETAIDLDGLRCLHPGRWLGVIKKDRFEPAHALALSVRSQAAAGGLDLDAHDPRLARYLQGETIEAPGRAGWALVSVDGYSLGWGKRVQEQLKSRYPRGLRRPG